MKNFISKLGPRTLLVTVILTLLSISMPFSASAEQGTLGQEEPYLYCTFTDASNEKVDGNYLATGTYTVDVNLSGMESVSIFEFTAGVNRSVITDISVDSTVADTDENFIFAGTSYNDDSDTLAVAVVSALDNCTDVNSDGTVMATLSVTVDAEAADAATIDFQQYFRFATDPDYTFVESDYRDGYNDAYVLDLEPETQYNKYLMTADESPNENELEPTITVSGKILIATDANGTASSFGLRGVTIYAYDDNNQVIASTISNSEGDKSTWGEYSLEVPAGTTSFMVGSPAPFKDTIVNRAFTIDGDADVTGADVAVVMCDYNDEGVINVVDKGFFNGYLINYDIYGDFNNDEAVNVVDKGFFNGILKNGGSGIQYAELHFE